LAGGDFLFIINVGRFMHTGANAGCYAGGDDDTPDIAKFKLRRAAQKHA
jgi:hypothetical protein